jgi:hypothetical protein
MPSNTKKNNYQDREETRANYGLSSAIQKKLPGPRRARVGKFSFRVKTVIYRNLQSVQHTTSYIEMKYSEWTSRGRLGLLGVHNFYVN